MKRRTHYFLSCPYFMGTNIRMLALVMTALPWASQLTGAMFSSTKRDNWDWRIVTNVARRFLLHCIVVTVAITVNPDNSRASHLYWTDFNTDSIKRSTLDGTNVVTVVNTGDLPRGIDIDVTRRHMYWAELGSETLYKSDLNGANLTTLATGQTDLYDVALTSNKIYWTSAGRIKRSNLDGTNAEDVVVGLDRPLHLAVDFNRNEIYWTEDRFSGNDRIRKATISTSGTSAALDVVMNLNAVKGISLDLLYGRIYWTEEPNGRGKIRRSDLVGNNIETLIDDTLTGDQFEDPFDLLVDPLNNAIYYGDSGFNKLRRSDLNGNNIVDLVTGVRGPADIAIGPVPEPSTALLALLGMLLFSVFGRLAVLK